MYLVLLLMSLEESEGHGVTVGPPGLVASPGPGLTLEQRRCPGMGCMDRWITTIINQCATDARV